MKTMLCWAATPSQSGTIIIDTKQVLDDVKIPNGDWGRADYLEPITKDNPRFGEGGATQAITEKSMHATKIIDLKTGKTVYESP